MNIETLVNIIFGERIQEPIVKGALENMTQKQLTEEEQAAKLKDMDVVRKGKKLIVPEDVELMWQSEP